MCIMPRRHDNLFDHIVNFPGLWTAACRALKNAESRVPPHFWSKPKPEFLKLEGGLHGMGWQLTVEGGMGAAVDAANRAVRPLPLHGAIVIRHPASIPGDSAKGSVIIGQALNPE